MAQAGKCKRKRPEIQPAMNVGDGEEKTIPVDLSDFDSIKRLKVENDVDRPVNDEYSLNSSSDSEEFSLSTSRNVKSDQQHQYLLMYRRGLNNQKVKFYSNGYAREINNGDAINGDGFIREIRISTPPLSEIMDSSSSQKSRKSALNLRTQPTAAEIDEFFSVAEKEDRTRFINKYNFDVVKDIPLAGKYEWVQIKP
ncbi:cyclin-dependent kinase inhibitor 7-like [Impatiens glandulifera]|uniref:cyclin-dependent kinase inhibitor 7-like n=1 Tax=Impatiens glandulifera TaxID=253017 RepID=UPI001FB0F8E9|nr:cyclin-dependent kinase inhibitor 7-like [Impatiens glandulifera]